MAISLLSVPFYSMPTDSQVHGNYNTNTTIFSRWRQGRTVMTRCSKKGGVGEGERERAEMNHYQLLGVSADSNVQEIKEAYRKLQKKFHPDIAGQEGHEYTLKLNEAYKVLMREELRREYDASIGQTRVKFGRYSPQLGYSSWKGPLRPQALFVDENACIGCRECAHHASNTFTMDDSLGCARVKVQFGDSDQQIQVSVDSCPVNCIYWVDREELGVLEYLIQPQPKEGYGVFGGGWERPANVFMAAKAFTKQLKQQPDTGHHKKYARATVQEETPAQAEARANASMKIKMERFSGLWNWVKTSFWDKNVE